MSSPRLEPSATHRPGGAGGPPAPSGWAAALGVARLPFLLLTPACMSMAVAWSAWARHAAGGAPVAWFDACLALLGALAAHVSVNAFNEHADFKSGLDARTRRTPFSGGSGVLPNQPALAPLALTLAVVSLLLALTVGLYFLLTRPGLLGSLMPLGLAGAALVVAYTPWVTRHPWACLVAPGLGFGPLMVLGTALALGAGWSWAAVWLAVLPFALVNNLLLLNQFPDVDADRTVGRRTLPMVLGRPAAVRMLGVQYLLGYASLALGVWQGAWPAHTLLGLLTLPIAALAWHGARQHANDTDRLLLAMGLNVAVSLISPLLVALGFWLAC